MMVAFFVGAWVLKLPIGLSIVLGAMVGSLFGGYGIPLRHFVEGSFTFLDTIMVIICAIVFMEFVRASGALQTVAREMINKFWRQPILLLLALMFIVMFPGMITGSSTAAVLTTGALVAPILISLGIPKVEAGCIIAMGAIYGKIAPPINIPVMIMCDAMDLPYMGFAVPLLVATVPLAIFSALYHGLKHLKGIEKSKVDAAAPDSFAGEFGFKIYIPFLFLAIMMILIRAFPASIPDPGMPLLMLISAALARVTGRPFNIFVSSKKAVKDAMMVTGILVGVGMFIQIMALTGVRGYIVVEAVGLPTFLFFIASTLALPAFGSMSSLGAASIFGFPLIIVFITAMARNPIIVASGLSLGAGLGDMVPPTALSGIFAAQVLEMDSYLPILKRSLLSMFLTIIVIFVFLYFANALDFLIL